MTGIGNDRVVAAIFEAVACIDVSPEQRRIAVVRAGLIAQAYQGDSLAEDVFGSSSDEFHNNDDLNLRRGSSADASAH